MDTPRISILWVSGYSTIIRIWWFGLRIADLVPWQSMLPVECPFFVSNCSTTLQCALDCELRRNVSPIYYTAHCMLFPTINYQNFNFYDLWLFSMWAELCIRQEFLIYVFIYWTDELNQLDGKGKTIWRVTRGNKIENKQYSFITFNFRSVLNYVRKYVRLMVALVAERKALLHTRRKLFFA